MAMKNSAQENMWRYGKDRAQHYRKKPGTHAAQRADRIFPAPNHRANVDCDHQGAAVVVAIRVVDQPSHTLVLRVSQPGEFMW